MSVEALNAPVAAEEGGARSRSGVLRRLARDKVAAIAALVLTLIALAAVFAPVMAPYDPYLTDLTKVMQPPSEEHWFGTDNTGRDILSRVIFGTRNTLMLGLIGVIIASLVNLFLGSTMLQFIVSVIGVPLYNGLTAWDTQRLKNDYIYGYASQGGDVAERAAITGALSLYLNFINLFTLLLQLLGQRD